MSPRPPASPAPASDPGGGAGARFGSHRGGGSGSRSDAAHRYRTSTRAYLTGASPRETGALTLLAPRLGPGAVVFLDDRRRGVERRILRRWAARFPNAKVELRRSAHGTGVVRWPGTPEARSEAPCDSA